MKIAFKVNGNSHSLKGEDTDMPLLWYLRENLNLKGSKFGCGIGQCGACTVHIDGQVVRACSVSLANLNNTDITTIEGLASEDGELHPVQKAWMELDVPQCGYCQAGQIMAATVLLANKPKPSDSDIDEAMTNICRCGTYVRIRKAIKIAAQNRVPARLIE